jgi:hypothetical protein
MNSQTFSLGKVGGMLKKKPMLIAGGLAVLLGGIVWYNKSNSSDGTVEYAAGTTEATSGAEDTSDQLDLTAMEEDLLSKMEDIQDKRFEDFETAQSSYLSDMFAGFEGQIEKYTQKYEIAAPIVEVESLLQKQINNVLSTESLLLETGYNYTTEDIAGMSNWATEEKKAIALGAMGTSKNPTGFGGKVTFNKDNTVSFGSGKITSSGPSIDEKTSASARAKVSKATGGSGTIESQLSSKSPNERVSILKKAGLY